MAHVETSAAGGPRFGEATRTGGIEREKRVAGAKGGNPAHKREGGELSLPQRGRSDSHKRCHVRCQEVSRFPGGALRSEGGVTGSVGVTNAAGLHLLAASVGEDRPARAFIPEGEKNRPGSDDFPKNPASPGASASVRWPKKRTEGLWPHKKPRRGSGGARW